MAPCELLGLGELVCDAVAACDTVAACVTDAVVVDEEVVDCVDVDD